MFSKCCIIIIEISNYIQRKCSKMKCFEENSYLNIRALAYAVDRCLEDYAESQCLQNANGSSCVQLENALVLSALLIKELEKEDEQR